MQTRNIGDTTFSEQITENIINYFNWGLLGIGAFFNVQKSNPKSIFIPSDDPNYLPGQAWESPRANWVWESGVGFTYAQPIQISGVYVNNVFRPNGSGFYINYIDSQIIFNTPLPLNSNVQMEYSHRRYNIYDSDTSWFEQVIFNPMPVSGVKAILERNRVYLPAIIIEHIPSRSFIPHELGSQSAIMKQAILFHILSDQPGDRNKLIDFLTINQYQKTVTLYDINKIADANAFPLNDNGSIASGAMTYPQLIDNFAWNKFFFSNVNSQEITTQLPLFRATIRATIETYIP
jgi:hypothetical protein